MTDKDIKDLLILIATFIVSFLFLSIPNLFTKIILMIIYFTIYVFVVRYINHSKLIDKIISYILVITELVIFIFSIVDTGSLANYFERISFFFTENNESEKYVLINNRLEEFFSKINEKTSEINNKIDTTNSNLTKMEEEFLSFKNNMHLLHFNCNDNPSIDQIIELIDKYKKDNFEELRTDRDTIELFYKIYISEEPYYYVDILEAFKNYGINIDKLNIDQNALVVWDLEILYATYNIKQSNITNLNSDEIIDDITFMFNDYKIKEQPYRDTLDYDGWHRNYSRNTAIEIDGYLNLFIMKYYNKFMLNFSYK